MLIPGYVVLNRSFLNHIEYAYIILMKLKRKVQI